MTGRILFKNTLEAYTDYYLQYKLNQVVQEHRLVSLITLLRGAPAEMFRNKDSVVYRKKKRRKQAPAETCIIFSPTPRRSFLREQSVPLVSRQAEESEENVRGDDELYSRFSSHIFIQCYVICSPPPPLLTTPLFKRQM